MHYKNGREAKNGDLVIGKPEYGVSVIAGIVQDINPAADKCNCTVIRPGGLIQSCVSCGDLYHADDAVVSVSKSALDVEPLAESIYEAYCSAVGGKAFNGDGLPDWKTFRGDPIKQKQSDAWMVAAKTALTALA